MERTEPLHHAEQFIKDSLRQAYTEAPWRKQVQFAALFLAVLIGIAMLAWIYLSVSSEAVKAGIEIQDMRSYNKHIRQANSDLEAEYALLTSASAMQKRVEGMGMVPLEPASLVYVMVPGYREDTVRLAAPSNAIALVQPNTDSPLMGPEFSQSWIDWLFMKMKEAEPLFRISREAQP